MMSTPSQPMQALRRPQRAPDTRTAPNWLLGCLLLLAVTLASAAQLYLFFR
jgi:hypothetical protein